MDDDFNIIDLRVLAALVDESLSKSEANVRITEHGENTIGKRIERLTDEGYVQRHQVSPRDRIDGITARFQTTEAGESVITDYRVCRGCEEVAAVDSPEHALLPAIQRFPDCLPAETLTSPDELDRTAVAILDQIMDEPLWKQKLSERLDWSPQTIGHRVDDMGDKGYVKAQLVRPSELTQNLIIGYQTTTKGAAVVEAEQAALREAEVCADCGELFGPDDHRHEFVPAREFFADDG